MESKTFKIKGMHCASCAVVIEKELKKVPGVGIVEANYGTESVRVIFDTARTINVFMLLLFAAIVYAISYLFSSWFFAVEEVYLLGKLLLKVKALRRRIEEVYTEAG